MSEFKELPSLPSDNLTLTSDRVFRGSGYVYESGENALSAKEIKFNIKQTKPLDPFYYHKPIENPTDPFQAPIEFVKDKEPRVGYYPLALISQALRPPNHLYEADDAILAAINRGTNESPKWETRYFTKGSLDPAIWKQALEILEV